MTPMYALLALVALATASPMGHEDGAIHIMDEPAQDDRTVTTAASWARHLVATTGTCELATMRTDGYPFASVEFYAQDCVNEEGNPIVLLANIASHTRNLQKSPKAAISIRDMSFYPKLDGRSADIMDRARFSLIGDLVPITGDAEVEAAKDCFIKTHPEAKYWRMAHTFAPYRMQLHAIQYLGGYGNNHFLGQIPLDMYHKAKPTTAGASLVLQE